MKVFAHLAAILGLLVVASVLFLATADDNSWYLPPPEGDRGDDDGYLVAAMTLMFYVAPLMVATYVAALLVGRKRSTATD